MDDQQIRTNGSGQGTKPSTKDSGNVKVSYNVEDDSKPSVLHTLKEKLLHPNKKHKEDVNPANAQDMPQPEVSYQLAAAADTPEETRLPAASGLNIRQSAGGTQEIPTTIGGSSSEDGRGIGLNIRQSAGGAREIPSSEDDENPSGITSTASQDKKVSRGEELGTGYEPDSESSGQLA